NEVKYQFIKENSQAFRVIQLCSAMKVSRSSYYAWLARPAKLITAKELHLYRRAKALFKRSRESLGYRELCK
ncbi:IS3 family transposase, partial [Pseudoalteromonas elyakovii]|nr:IS3 family transposase [Pseudoalteromonas elyakovii]